MSERKMEMKFEDLPEDTRRALYAYAGSDCLERQIVVVTVEDLGSYSFEDFPTTIDGAMAWFSKARDKTPAEYRAALQVRLEYERGRWDEGDCASLKVWYERPETNEEMATRIDGYMKYVRASLVEERRQYEALKQKFG